MTRCANPDCRQRVTSDGYGELIHEATGLYGCDVIRESKNDYPVAR